MSSRKQNTWRRLQRTASFSSEASSTSTNSKRNSSAMEKKGDKRKGAKTGTLRSKKSKRKDRQSLTFVGMGGNDTKTHFRNRTKTNRSRRDKLTDSKSTPDRLAVFKNSLEVVSTSSTNIKTVSRSQELPLFTTKTIGRTKSKSTQQRQRQYPVTLHKKSSQISTENVRFEDKKQAQKRKKKEAYLRYRQKTRDRGIYRSNTLSSAVTASTGALEVVAFSQDLSSLASSYSTDEEALSVLNIEKKQVVKQKPILKMASMAKNEVILKKVSDKSQSKRKKKFSSMTSTLRSRLGTIFTKDKFGMPSVNTKTKKAREEEIKLRKEQLASDFLDKMVRKPNQDSDPDEIQAKKDTKKAKQTRKPNKYGAMTGGISKIGGMISDKVTKLVQKDDRNSLYIFPEFRSKSLSAIDMTEAIDRELGKDAELMDSPPPTPPKRKSLKFLGTYNNKSNRILVPVSPKLDDLNGEVEGNL